LEVVALRLGQLGTLKDDQRVAFLYGVTQSRLHLGQAATYDRANVRHLFRVELDAGRSAENWSKRLGHDRLDANTVTVDRIRRELHLAPVTVVIVIVMVIMLLPQLVRVPVEVSGTAVIVMIVSRGLSGRLRGRRIVIVVIVLGLGEHEDAQRRGAEADAQDQFRIHRSTPSLF
jgi:hypothetical protein